MMVSYGLLKEGLDNLVGIFGGTKKAEDILSITPKKLVNQVEESTGPRALPKAIIDGGPKVLEAAGLDFGKWAKYAKYALIGGAGLLAYSAIKKR